MAMPIQNKVDVIALLMANRSRIKSFGVESLSLFGSFVNGKPDAGSDVDFLVNFDPKQKSFDNFMDLSFFLEDLLGRKVEVITPQSLNKYIGPHIQNQAENVPL